MKHSLAFEYSLATCLVSIQYWPRLMRPVEGLLLTVVYLRQSQKIHLRAFQRNQGYLDHLRE